MAIKTIRLGSIEDAIQYDNAVYPKSISVSDPIECTSAPVGASDVLRKGDIGTDVGDVVGPALSVDSNIAEFDGVTGKKIKDSGVSHVNLADAIAKKHSNALDHAQGSDTSLGALTAYANNAAAVAGGLASGDLYRTGADPDVVCIVH